MNNKSRNGGEACSKNIQEDVYVTAWLVSGEKPLIFASPFAQTRNTLHGIYGIAFLASNGRLGYDNGVNVSVWDEKKKGWVIRNINQNFKHHPDQSLFVRPSHFRDEDCTDLAKHIPNFKPIFEIQRVSKTSPQDVSSTSTIYPSGLEKDDGGLGTNHSLPLPLTSLESEEGVLVEGCDVIVRSQLGDGNSSAGTMELVDPPINPIAFLWISTNAHTTS